MHIRVGYEIAYECPQATPMILMLSVHPSRRPDLATPERIEVGLVAGEQEQPLLQVRMPAPGDAPAPWA